ncbi:hypothetical protein L3X38_005353 [Prunus dulcis]|uniref:Late embryogenesis abundant protein LEA-2 subgroup domain-containing protein n=1 Tax=Prunus dulcis TaxID=3755 RepID=A0AAD4ZQI0_PRUDU|nr:hypothetical protein L3X38_005353 [Prunus dulcis]
MTVTSFALFFNLQEPEFSVTNAFLTQFTFDTATDQNLHDNLTIDITITNPNKRVGIEYRDIQATAMCGHKTFAHLSLGGGILAPFYQGHKNTTILHNLLGQGKQLVRFEEAKLCNCKSETVAGVYSIDLQLALRVKARYGMSFKGISNKIGILCKLLVPLITFGTSVDGNGDECFKTTKCFNTKTFFPEKAEPVVELAKDAFYVVRKGDIVGVYKNFGDCQAQLSSSLVLRADDGSLICKLHEGLVVRTNNVAGYRALILGVKYALKKGFTKIRVKGDSKLVCMQVQGLWMVRNQNMSDLCEEVKELKDKFLSFEISHVPRSELLLKMTVTRLMRLLPKLTNAVDLGDEEEDDVPIYSNPTAASAVKRVIPTLLQPRVVVYDGVCHLCLGGVKWVIKAEDVLRRFLFVEGPGLYHQGSTAALKVLSYLPLPYSALSAFRVIPTPLREIVYDYVAKRRYDIFGKSEDCLVLQEKELLERFIDREEIMYRARPDF